MDGWLPFILKGGAPGCKVAAEECKVLKPITCLRDMSRAMLKTVQTLACVLAYEAKS